MNPTTTKSIIAFTALVTLLAILITQNLNAQIQSAGSGDWHMGSTWVGGNVPSSADDIEILTGHVITLSSPVTVDMPGNLDIAGTLELTQGINGTANKHILSGGVLNSSGGTMSGGGEWVVESGGILNVNTTSYIGSSTTLRNHGTFNWLSGHINEMGLYSCYYGAPPPSYFINETDGIWNINISADFHLGAVWVTNHGVMNKTTSSTLEFHSGCAGSTLNNTSTGTLNVLAGQITFNSGNTVLNGVLDLDGTLLVNTTANIGAAISLDGTLTLSSISDFSSAVTLAGSGTLNVSYSLSIPDNFVFTIPTINLAGSITGAGIKTYATGVNVNLNGGGLAGLEHVIQSGAMLNINGGSFGSSTTIRNQGTINWQSGFVNEMGLFSCYYGAPPPAILLNEASGTVNLNQPGASHLGATHTTNNGVFNKTTSSLFTFHSGCSGSPFTNAASGEMNGIGTMQFDYGFTNLGTIAPGLSPGELTLNFATVPNSILDIQLASASGPGTGHDRLNVNGNFIATGTLNVTLEGGYDPPIGTSFEIVSATGTITNEFTTVNYPAGMDDFYLTYNAQTILLTRGTAPPPPPLDLTLGLIAYYPFDGNASDEAGMLDGTPSNGATLTEDRTCQPNSAYLFDGTDDYISFPGPPTTQTDNYTLSAWVSPNTNVQDAIAVELGDTGNGYSMGMGMSTGGGAGFEGMFSGVTYLPSGASFANSGEWYHIVMLRSAGISKFYLNGVQTSNTFNFTPNVPTNFRIGGQAGVRYWNGKIDDVRIYNRVFDADEVMALYNVESGECLLPDEDMDTYTSDVDCNDNNPDINPGATEICNGVDDDCDGLTDEGCLIAHWTFSNNFNDETNNNTATESGGVVFDEGVGCEPLGATHFDGLDDYVSIGDLYLLENASSLTVSAWIYKEDNTNYAPGFVGKWNGSGNPDNTFLLYNGGWGTDNKGHFAVQFNDNTEAGIAGTTDLPIGEWTHIVGVWNSADGFLGLYKNGVLAASSLGLGTGKLLDYSTNYSAKIGAWGVLHGAYTLMKGGIDNVRIYSDALDAGEVMALYNLENVTCQIDEDGDTYTIAEGDCDDSDPDVNPGATEVCNTIDDDCDGLIDDDDPDVTGQPTWYIDNDGDGFGTGSPILACDQPVNTADNDEDCDDTEEDIYPGATEICNGIDDNCDGTVDEGLADADNDGVCDAIDNCPAIANPGQEDNEGDGIGDICDANDDNDPSNDVNDCAPFNPLIYPGATEVCGDLVDNDCDGLIDEPFGMVVLVEQDILCNGQPTGLISVAGTCGLAPYSYIWNNGATSATISNLSVGTYRVTITDDQGLTQTQTFFITQPSMITVSTSRRNVSCNGSADGSATANPNGGESPYTYLWSNGATTKTANNLVAGTYTVTVTDNNLCTKTATVTITQPTALEITSVDVVPDPGNPGKFIITVYAQGGTPYNDGYRYRRCNANGTGCAAWRVSNVFTNMAAGTHLMRVKDKIGCTDEQLVTVQNPPALLIVPDAIVLDEANDRPIGQMEVESTYVYKPLEVIGMTLLPNPGREFVMIRWNASEVGPAQITMHDLSGKLMHQEKVDQVPGKNEYQHSTSEFKSGMYIITLKTPQITQSNFWVKTN